MEQQQHCFSDSTPRAGNDILQKKTSKSLLSELQLMSLVKLATKSMGQVISTLFKSQEKFVQ